MLVLAPYGRSTAINITCLFDYFKGRTIRKVMGGGGVGAGEVQKKNSCKGKLSEKKFMHAE